MGSPEEKALQSGTAGSILLLVSKDTSVNEYFPSDSYDTPPDTKRFLMDRLFMGSRWWFYTIFMKTILKYRSLALAGRYDSKGWVESSYEVFKQIEGCGGRFHIRGLDNIRNSSEPVVLVSNHMSTLETMVFPALIVPSKPLNIVVKDELVKNFIFGPIMLARHPIVVGRKDAAQDLMTVISGGAERVADGNSVLLFPQSTREAGFNSERFNSLGVKLARRAGVKIVPVAIKTDFWGVGKFIKELGPISRDLDIFISFGKPLTIQNKGLEEHRAIVEFISENMAEWEKNPRIEP